jgi:hypothetical protein
VGLATDYCVRASTIDACRLGFDTTVVTDAIRAVDVNPGDGDRALEEMKEAGAKLVTSDRVAARQPPGPFLVMHAAPASAATRRASSRLSPAASP